DAETGEPLAGAHAFVAERGRGAATDADGAYRLELPPGVARVRFSYVGYRSVVRTARLDAGDRVALNAALAPEAIEGEAVTVYGERREGLTESKRLDDDVVRKMPTLYHDPMRAVKILPGVTSNNELASDYHARGGAYAENLIYLNGYEIYRPFLLRRGVEENQSLANPDMTRDLEFYNGAFPASYGDKLSSVLEIDYRRPREEPWRATVRADLLNGGASVRRGWETASLNVGARYAYPTLFLGDMQTQGTYRPSYHDVQALANVDLADDLTAEIFGVYARNVFDHTPETWLGHFRLEHWANIDQIRIEYDGDSRYGFTNALLGGKLVRRFSDNSALSARVSLKRSSEEERRDLRENVYYSDDPEAALSDMEYLKTRRERAANDATVDGLDATLEWRGSSPIGALTAGASFGLHDLAHTFDEESAEEGRDSLLFAPQASFAEIATTRRRLNFYITHTAALSDRFAVELGARTLTLLGVGATYLSPRFGLDFTPRVDQTFSLRWGYYRQPPFLHELVDKSSGELLEARTQTAIHYLVGWRTVADEMTYEIEAYYKDLVNVSPFYLDRLRLVYGDEPREGYTLGVDATARGEVVHGIESWFGYSFLRSRERPQSGGSYERRVLDQTHTLRIFLQDRFKKHPNYQAHVRFLFGSGFLFYPRSLEDDRSGEPARLAVNYDGAREMWPYLRADMGLTATYDVFGAKLVVAAEVLNLFNNYNLAGYRWTQIFPQVRAPFSIPEIYSRRFFNVSVSASF
ncbi:MAG: hypothetical protein GF419_05400, partial [Ignavibacteriales bacterium]|nr:hypothetical protein [Ignavibacteriales bacterium]